MRYPIPNQTKKNKHQNFSNQINNSVLCDSVMWSFVYYICDIYNNLYFKKYICDIYRIEWFYDIKIDGKYKKTKNNISNTKLSAYAQKHAGFDENSWWYLVKNSVPYIFS